MKRVTLALFFSLTALSLPAQDATVLRLSLDETLSRAREKSARLGQFQALEQAADAALRGARAGRLPQLDLSAGYTRNSNVPELILANPGAPPRVLFPNIPDNWRARAGLALPLYTGGRVAGAIAGAAEQRSAASLDAQAARADLTLETTSAYWSLVTARESLNALSEGLRAFDQHLKDARNRQSEGLAARNEVLAVEVERDRAELSRLQAQNAAAVATANLQRLLDLSSNTVIEPTEPLLAPEGGATLRAALEASALETRAELKALRARVAAARASVRVQHAAALPQASLQAGYEYARPNPRILPLSDVWNDTWSVGISVGVTAFDGGRIAAATAQARAQADALQQQLEDAQRRVRLDVAQRVLELETARAAVAVASHALAAARENVQVAGDRYREGVSSSSELLDAEAALLRANLGVTESQTSLRMTLASLDRAVGR